MRCGDIVVAAPPGTYGKPRPALVVQNDAFSELQSIVILPFTSDLKPLSHFRIPLEPKADNGLEMLSQIMVDKVVAIPLGKIGQRIGRIDETTMQAVNTALERFIGCRR